MPMTLPLIRSSSGIPGVDGDAVAWAIAVLAAGGTYSVSTLAAVSNFCVSAKAASLWTKLNRVNLFCGDQLAAALVPLKVGGGSATDTNVNFVGGDYTEATGLTGNGTTKYLRTGHVLTSLPAQSTSLGVYCRTQVFGATAVFMGAEAAGGVEFRSILYTTGT